MRAHEIISKIEWADGVPAADRAAVEDAIRALDRQVHGTNRPKHDDMEVHRRVEALVKKCGSSKAAAAFCGVSQSVMSDARNSHRKTAPAILAAVGLMSFRQRNFYVDIDLRHDDVIEEDHPKIDDSGLRHGDVIRKPDTDEEQAAFLDKFLEDLVSG